MKRITAIISLILNITIFIFAYNVIASDAHYMIIGKINNDNSCIIEKRLNLTQAIIFYPYRISCLAENHVD